MVRRFLHLPISDRRLVVESTLLVVFVRLALWVLPYATLRDWLRRRRKSNLTEPYSCSRVVWAVSAAARYIPKASCLTQALAAETLLRVYGHPATIHIGVAKNGSNSLEAHAWVESRGEIVLGGSGRERFTPLGQRGL
jgi:hypothetical protein